MNAGELLAAHIKARRIVVVDDDISVFDPEEAEWAEATRVLPDRDILIIPPVSRGLGEPTASERLSARWAIDATMPLKDREWYKWYKRVRVPGL